MNWLFQAAKTGRIKSLAQAIREFFNMNGRMPSVRERNTMGSILQDITQKSNVIEFPKNRITNPFKSRPTEEELLEAEYRRLKSLSPDEVKAEMRAKGLTPVEERPPEEVTASFDRIRKGFSTQMKLNRPEENQALIKSFMKRENAEFNSLSREQQKEILDMFDAHMRPKPDMASGGIAGPLHLYEGGRANYDKGGMSRRKFLQLFGGLASVPLLGKYFKWAKPLSKTSGVITRGTDGIPSYAFDLIEVVKAKGTKEIMEGLYRKTPPSTKYNYKGVEVVEDGMGNTSVTKQQEKMGRWQYGEDDVLVEPYVDREIGFEIRKGEDVINKKGQPVQTPDEYTENTAKLQGDPEGGTEVSEVLEYIDDADHLELQKIADEGSFLTQKRKRDKITRIKEAEGGRIGYESGKKVWPPKEPNPYGGFDPGTLPKNFMNKMPLIDPRLRDLIKEYKKRKGLAEILGV